MSDSADLKLILAHDAAGAPQLWACRGEGKGCERNRYRKSLKPCADCLGPLPETMTLAEVYAKLSKGDA